MLPDIKQYAVEVDVSVGTLFDAKGRRNKKTFPTVRPLGRWDASQPRVVLSKDGVVLLAAFPDFLKDAARVSHFRIVEV